MIDRRVRPDPGAPMSSAPNVNTSPQTGPEVVPVPSWADLLDTIPSPKSLVEHLDRHVVGQGAAKKKLAGKTPA